MLAALLALIAPAGLVVSIEGTPGCPSVQDVQAALADLGTGGAMHELRVEVQGDSTIVTARGADGGTLAQKVFVGPHSCGERTQLVAVFASTWEAATGLSSPLADVQVPVAPPVPARAEADVGARVPADAGAPQQTLRMGAGVLGLAGVGAGGAGWGAHLEASYRPSPRWGVRTELFGVWPPALELGADTDARYRRLGLGLGALTRKPLSWGSLIAHGNLLLAHTLVQGDGVESNADASAWVPGVSLGGGVDVELAPGLRAFFELAALAWSRAERVVWQEPPGQSGSQRLPRVDVLLRLTLAWEKNVGGL